MASWSSYDTISSVHAHGCLAHTEEDEEFDVDGFPNEQRITTGSKPCLLVELTAKTSHHLICSAISRDGSLLAYSSEAGVRVFLAEMVLIAEMS